MELDEIAELLTKYENGEITITEDVKLTSLADRLKLLQVKGLK